MQLKIKKLSPDAITPTYATEGSACFDLYCTNEAIAPPEGSALFGTGLAFGIPKDHVMLVFSRSGMGFKQCTRLSNSVGVIDSDYSGEVKVKLTNDGLDLPVKVEKGCRIAQAMIIPYDKVAFLEVDELESTERGDKGFGSSGS